MTAAAPPSPAVRDFTRETCTNLMIRLKILTKRMPPGSALEFFTTREGHANVRDAFRRKFELHSEQCEPNKFFIRLGKPA